MIGRLGISGGVSIVAIVLAGSPASAQQAAPVYRLDAVEVTANKRPQRLGEVDGTVAVRTAEELDQAHVTKVEDLDRVFPGLVIRERGNRAYSNISVRGVTSSDFYNPAVQVYVDGVPQDPAYFTQEMVNVERVELLRGPQGTLYGRNAHGGVINIITRKPGDKLEGNVGGTFANRERETDGTLATPIVPGLLFGDVSLRYSEDLGEIDDIATGRDNIDDSHARMGRARLRHAPTGGPLDVMVTAQREVLRSHEEFYLREALVGDRKFNSLTQGPDPLLDRRVNSYALNANYDFGGAVLTSVTSYQDRKMTRVLSGRNFPEDQDSVAEELRLSFGSGGPLSGVVGAFTQDTDFTRRDPGFPGFFGASENQVGNRSYALFGELTYALTEAVDLTGGLRWSREDAEIDFVRTAPSGFAFAADDSFSDVSPKVALGWQLAQHSRVYALAARGFKPGGFNHTVSNPGDQIPYKSETSTNLEVGWRGQLFAGVVELGAAAYWIEAQDKQIFVGPLGFQVLRNVGDAESRGVDLDVNIRPTDALTFTLGANIGRSVFVDAVDPQTGANYDGNRLPYAPDRMFLAAARYIVPQTFIPGALSLRGAGRYYSQTYYNEANTLSQDGYVLIDASVDVALTNGLTVGLFGNNLTDKTYRTSSFLFGPGDVRSTIGDGRVVGVVVRLTF
jgi:pesticin/yersiniabactin receptor